MPKSPGIDLRHLRYFLAVFDELHFGRAAARLHIAQPPLSQTIRKLEQELGVQLFVRTSRAVEATPAGRALAEEARKALASFEFAIAEARAVGSREDAPLKIGCIMFLPMTRLQRFLTALRQRIGHLRTDVTHLLGGEQVEGLRSGRLDLGVLWHTEDYPDLECEPLFAAGHVSAFLPAGHRLADKPELTPDDLASETLLTFPRAASPVFYDRYAVMLADAGYRFRGLHETSTDPRDLLLAVEGGLGVAFSPASLIDVAEDRAVTRRPIAPQLEMPDLIVAWRGNPPRRLRARLAAVREAARELHAESLPQDA